MSHSKARTNLWKVLFQPVYNVDGLWAGYADCVRTNPDNLSILLMNLDDCLLEITLDHFHKPPDIGKFCNEWPWDRSQPRFECSDDGDDKEE